MQLKKLQTLWDYSLTRQREFIMRKPLEHIRLFTERRKAVSEKLKGGVLVLGSLPESLRNGNVHNAFRQDSQVYYMTGFEEPGTVFVFRPGLVPETIMFVRKKDPVMETWDGFRFGIEGVKAEFGIAESYPIEELSTRLPALLKGADRVYYRWNRNSNLDSIMLKSLDGERLANGRSGLGSLPVFDSDELLGEFRVIKSDLELLNHRRACEISAEAHVEVMKYVKPKMSEREIHGFFIYQAMKRGAAREGYNGIVAGGANATTLHYVFNDETLNSEQLLLIDCGAEFNYFTGDITRTYPINGQFSKAQKTVYESVLHVQKTIIEMVKPGVAFQEFHDKAIQMLTDIMLDLGLLNGRREDNITSLAFKKYYPHGIGHFLGMDVHDLGKYFSRETKESRKIEPGMVFTVEPGLYIPINDETAPQELRGIGVRIEDNILVTENGYENLTKIAPKEISELENIIGSQRH